jgi:hypothetical protein
VLIRERARDEDLVDLRPMARFADQEDRVPPDYDLDVDFLYAFSGL